MFSDNQRITAAQMKLLLITDWAGKMMLVVPGMLGHIGARNAVLAAAAGTLLAAGAARGLGSSQNRRKSGRSQPSADASWELWGRRQSIWSMEFI